MVKWQDIAKYVGSGTVGLFLVLAGILNMTGMTSSIPGDQVCNDCYDMIQVNSTIWEIKAEHAGADKDIIFAKRMRSRTRWVNLDKIDEFVDTSPKVNVEILVPTTKRYATVIHPEFGYLRLIKDGDSLIARKNKGNPNGDRFIIHGVTGGKTIKWGMSLDDWLMKGVEFDPYWYSSTGTGSLVGQSGNASTLLLSLPFDENYTDGVTADWSSYQYKAFCDEAAGDCPSFNVSGYSGSAIWCDGDDDYINTTLDVNLTGDDFTISYWIKYVSGTYGIAQAKSFSPYGSVFITPYTTSIFFIPTPSTNIGDIALINDDEWHSVDISYDESELLLSVYVDGVLADSDTLSEGLTSLGSVILCSRGDAVSSFFEGMLDNIKIWNRVLSADEVAHLYRTTLKGELNTGDLTQGLVAHYPLSNESLKNDTLASDMTPNGNDGTITWGVSDGFVADQMGVADRAYDFDGSATYINLGTSSDIISGNPSNLTLSGWVKINTLPISVGFVDARIITLATTSGSYVALGVDDTGMIAGFTLDGAGATEMLGGSVTTGVWQHYVLVRDNWNHTFYLDGEVSGNSVSYISSTDVGNADATIGNLNPTGTDTRYFNGSISDVKIFNRALSPAEVMAEYESYNLHLDTGSLTKGLIFDMPLTLEWANSSDGTGTDDTTPYGNDGAVVNAIVEANYTYFDGTGDYVNVFNSSVFDFTGGKITVSSWFRTVNNGAIAQQAVAKQYGGTATANSCYQTGLLGDDFRWAIGGVFDEKLVDEVENNVWYHLVGTYDSTVGWNIYLDGVLRSNGGDTGAIRVNSAQDLTIGSTKYDETIQYGMDGDIADVKIWNRVLSAQEVKLSFQQSCYKFGVC